jgi:hypothetical protein
LLLIFTVCAFSFLSCPVASDKTISLDDLRRKFLIDIVYVCQIPFFLGPYIDR